MKKEFIVSKIEASQDGSPYVYVAFADGNTPKSGRQEGAQERAFLRAHLVSVLVHLRLQKT